MADLRMTETEREAFLAEPRVAVIAISRDDGRPPLTTPVWYHYAPGGNLTFYTKGNPGQPAAKTVLLERAGVLSVCVQRAELPYKYATIEGRLTGTTRPPSEDQLLAIVRRYLPEEDARGFVATDLVETGTDLVLFTIRPERWLTADFGKAELG